MSGSAFAPVPPGTDARKESLIEYPCAFPIKIMGGNIPGFVAALVHVAQRFDPAFDDASVELRESKGGKYLGVTLTVQQRLSVLHQALAGLLHWFGLPEPAQILADGSIVPRQFTMSRYREAEAWATANGVSAEGLRET